MTGDIKTLSNTQQALFEEMVISNEWDFPEQKKKWLKILKCCSWASEAKKGFEATPTPAFKRSDDFQRFQSFFLFEVSHYFWQPICTSRFFLSREEATEMTSFKITF